jgi:hypothetical protein
MKTMDRGAAIRIRSASWEPDLSRYRAVAGTIGRVWSAISKVDGGAARRDFGPLGHIAVPSNA